MTSHRRSDATIVMDINSGLSSERVQREAQRNDDVCFSSFTGEQQQQQQRQLASLFQLKCNNKPCTGPSEP